MKRTSAVGPGEASRQFQSRLDQKALILMYHRVAQVGSDPWSLCVTPEHFAEQLEVLQGYAHPVRLQQLTGNLPDGDIPFRSAVLTFDDGYSDNLHNAKPLLERYGVPATVFIATGYIGQGREFWWDELENTLLQPGSLPETLRLSINGTVQEWDLADSIQYEEDARRQNRNWRAWEDPPTSRHSIFCSLWGMLQPLTESERREVLDELAVWAGAREVNQTGATLSRDELIALEKGQLVEVGSHTVTHPVLSALPAAVQNDEIQHSKADLEEVLGHPVTSFAYPYGARSNYTDETVAIVREAGYACALSTLEGAVGLDSDRFQLPRLQVQDWDGEEFARRLSVWFDCSKN